MQEARAVLEIPFHLRTLDYQKSPKKSTPKEDLISLEIKVGCRFFKKIKKEKIKITEMNRDGQNHMSYFRAKVKSNTD